MGGSGGSRRRQNFPRDHPPPSRGKKRRCQRQNFPRDRPPPPRGKNAAQPALLPTTIVHRPRVGRNAASRAATPVHPPPQCAVRRTRHPTPYPAPRAAAPLVLAALLALCAAAPAARAEPVLVVGDDTATLRDDPALPPDTMTAPPAAEGSARAPTATDQRRRPDRPRHARPRRASGSDHRPSSTTRGSRPTAAPGRPRAGCAAAAAASCGRSSPGSSRSRGGELLTSTRMPAAFLQLQRNAEFWPTRSFPKAPQPERKPCTGAAGLGGGRVTFEGDPVVFQWYPGQGLQIQPLANFGKANALWRACQPPEQPPQPGAEPPPPCRPEELRALLDRMVALASQRGGFTAWEYFFAFGGGTPPWISGLAQGTAIQALDARLAAARRPALRRGRPRRARRVRGAGRRSASAPPRRAASGRHYLIYSFSSGLRVLNGFLQSLVGLYDFADATNDAPRASGCSAPATAPRAARSRATTPARGRSTRRAARSPTSATTGSCATSSSRCATARRRRAYCGRAKTLRPLPARAHARRLRRRRRGAPRRGRQRPLHALQALLRDAAGAPR